MHDQDILPDRSANATADGQWMTVAELAALRGISMGSVTRLVRQRRWRRQPDHHGRVRVLVPHGAMQPDEASAPAAGHSDRHSEASRGLRERVKAAEQRAERAEIRARAAEQARAAAEAAARVEHDRVSALLAQAETALAAERKARIAAEVAAQNVVPMDRAVEIAMQAEAAQLRQLRQAEAARRARGRFGRLLAAWRGE